jgi:hypothetical protein
MRLGEDFGVHEDKVVCLADWGLNHGACISLGVRHRCWDGFTYPGRYGVVLIYQCLGGRNSCGSICDAG